MIAIIDIEGQQHRVDLSAGIDISIPVAFSSLNGPQGAQPSAFGAPKARAEPLEFDGYVMSTALNGSCNVDVVTIIPHCNGTHTECVGHIVDDDVSITSILRPGFTTAWLVSISPLSAQSSTDSYTPDFRADDLIITRNALQTACTGMPPNTGALIVRTLPNGSEKLARDYNQIPAPFFSNEAIDFIAGCKVHHLLVDFPSIDRANDGGRMENHHRYWGIAPHERRLPKIGDALTRSVTEFVYVPDSLSDGRYLLDLQIAPFALDAAPSRPVLFKLE